MLLKYLCGFRFHIHLPAFKLVCTYYSLTKGCAFIVALATAKYFNKGYNIMKYARK